MDMTIDQQVALNEALVPHASRLRIGKSNFCLRSDIASKESTLQVVYDVLRLTLFYKAFLVTADMVNTRTDADLSAAVQNALQTLLPQIREEIREEFRTRSHGQNNDRQGSDRRGGSDNHRSRNNNNNYSGSNNRLNF
nr:hypothetical protein [Tanacetum cinerariifolium]